MIVSLVVHMFSTMILKAYRKPRELTWVTGFALFVIALGFGFSGYLLPWNELSFFATAVGTDSVKSVPPDRSVVAGGDARRNRTSRIDTLYRFFALHIVILPLVMVAVVSDLHLHPGAGHGAGDGASTSGLPGAQVLPGLRRP